MSPIEIAMELQKKHMILGAGIVFGCLWLLLVFYFLTEGQGKDPAHHVEVAVHPASPVAGSSAPSVAFRSSRLFTPQVHYSAPTPQWSYIQQAPMSSTSMHIYQTSSATVHQIGGGGAGGGIALTSGGGNSSRGVRTSAISYGGSMVALSSSIALASPGASEATSLASTTESGASHARFGHIRTTTGDPMDPFLDPVGDVAWALMVLLTIGWCVRVRLKKQ